MNNLDANTIRRLSEYDIKVIDTGKRSPYRTDIGLGDLNSDELYLVMLTVQSLHRRGRLKKV